MTSSVHLSTSAPNFLISDGAFPEAVDQPDVHDSACGFSVSVCVCRLRTVNGVCVCVGGHVRVCACHLTEPERSAHKRVCTCCVGRQHQLRGAVMESVSGLITRKAPVYPLR